jgi:predicted membrane-bound spermidine synthase
VSERPGVPLLAVFGIAELGIAAFGALSLKIFHRVALITAGASALETGVITFFLVLVPTVLMGGTLPILVAYLVRISGNVGRSVGILYFVNTLGSAAACFCAAYFTMHYLGQSGSVMLAASINTTIGAAMLVLYFYTRKIPARRDPAPDAVRPDGIPAPEPESHVLPQAPALLLSGMAGFIALGYEIMWYRIYAFTSGGQARAFALLLGFYLAGIAFGSLLTRVFCHQMTKSSLSRHLRILAGFVLLANICGYLVIPLASRIATAHGYLHSLPFVSLATILLGATFPLISHAAVRPNSRAGAHLSFLYLSNIVGSTLGSFVVGYVLMDIWAIKAIAVVIAAAGIGLAATVFLSSKVTGKSAALGVALGAGLVASVIVSSGPLFDRVYERLQEKWTYTPGFRYRLVVETKSGVVTVTSEGMVFGGGIYDGRFNTDIANDINGLFRPYSMSLWHPAPRQVLLIGMASGSWAQVLANHPQVEKLTVVEINPGYLGLIPLYPAVADVLTNPKVKIVIDDGRRWLVGNRESSFDVIVMNTTYNWRAHVTNLVSTEFLQLARRGPVL